MGRRAVRRGWEPPYYTVFRLCAQVAAWWDAWDGALALQGIDPHTWPLKRMLNAAEAQLDAGAKDDSERARRRAELYAPPKGYQARTGPSARPRPAAMGLHDAQALMAAFASEDARLMGR